MSVLFLFRHLEIAALGIASFQLFVQINWTGREEFGSSILSCPGTLVKEGLILDGESLAPVVKNPELLLLARLLLFENSSAEVIRTSFSSKFVRSNLKMLSASK